MKVTIRSIEDPAAEQVVIECTSVTSEIEDIRAYALSKGAGVTGTASDGRMKRLRLEDIFYFEAVDEKVFAYTKNEVFEIKQRLYEIEQLCRPYCFMRVSKSAVVNLMRMEGISPSLNGRYTARLKNGEKIVISRKYAPDILARVMGG